ncbi:exodeoxyribonuclease I [Vogesella sp. LIG4]|uniref:exodeoxyribonuclease I n=1 Tax=Vogesella sp. LIG4 TaxID=1192162 RepID=UPI00081FD819|nr:exodeoxyribonuclease I [Vogesella sp. LIG4]SCK20116.1 Exodeoxyribonuclease I subunit C [Vogesella sp. LIG4]
MTQPTFFWLDYETFGAVPRSDRPSQFAGIRTDAALNEIGEPVMLYCQPTPDYLPAPEACLLTGITPQLCQQRGVPEHQFAAAIEAELAAPGTIGVGYNSIRFDDEVTRFLFWRNLIDPYAREWQHGCGRWDLLDVVRATYALRPEGIEWPRHEDGLPSFKLEHLSAANGLLHEAAHDALSDVRATIALARLIRNRQPKLFEFCLSLRQKDTVRHQLSLHAPKPLIHVSGMFGSARGNLAIVWPLAEHPSNKNEVLVWDLAHDPSELLQLDADEIRLRLFSRSDALPEGVSRLPVKGLHVNKSPFVVSDLRVLSPSRAEALGIDMALIERHAAIAAGLPRLDALWRQVYQREAGGAPDVDENLYGGFVSNHDRRLLSRLRQLTAPQLAAERPVFDDSQLGRLLWRYRARNFPHSLNAEEARHWQAWCTQKLTSGQPGGRSHASYQQELATLAATATPAQQDILQALAAWAAQLPGYAG